MMKLIYCSHYEEPCNVKDTNADEYDTVCHWCASGRGTNYMHYMEEVSKEEYFGMPPLGIPPKYIVDEKRLKDINDAIMRRLKSGDSIPTEWLTERDDLVKVIKERKNTEC